jgi:hypothetical protein
MPSYDFLNTETGEVEELFMSFTKLDEFKKNNPHMKQQVSAPNIVGGTISVHENKDGGFNDMMQRIGDANPGSQVAKKYNKRTAKQVKVDQVANKYGYRK